MTVTLTAATQATYPPRVVLGVTGLTVGDDIIVYRSTGGTRTAVRGGTVTDTTDTGLATVDAELPFGVPVTYVATVNGADVATAGPTTYTLTGGKVALSDAITGLAAEVVIVTQSGKDHDRAATLFRAGGRNIVVAGDLGDATYTLDLYVASTSSSDQLRQLLATATEDTVQIRQPGGYAGVDAYLGVLTAQENRFSDRGSDERRRWVLSVADVEPWADELQARGDTLQDLADYYGTSGTLQDIHDDVGGTLLDIALKDYS